MSEEVKSPLGVKGKYYVDKEICLDHECCVGEAPNNFRKNPDSWEVYVYKQPETRNEEAQCEMAMDCCPVLAIFDDGESE